MNVILKMTKDPKNHKSFLVGVPNHTFKDINKVLKALEKKTGVKWKVNETKTNSTTTFVETGDLTKYFRTEYPLEEKAYVNWRMKWKNQEIDIKTGK